jgi:hypothetical protein
MRLAAISCRSGNFASDQYTRSIQPESTEQRACSVLSALPMLVCSCGEVGARFTAVMLA